MELHGKPAQVSIFDILGITAPTEFTTASRRVAFRKRAKKKKHKGVQYKIKLRIRENDRKLEFRSKSAKEKEIGNDETKNWSLDDIKHLHYVVLLDALMTLKNLTTADSPKAAEILLWMMSNSSGPFSFNQCVFIAGELSIDPDHAEKHPDVLDVDFYGSDPAMLRSAALRLTKQTLGALPVFLDRFLAGVKSACDGDQAAMDWCLSDDRGHTSFVMCCEALGFSKEEGLELLEARRQKFASRNVTVVSA